jgi:hypothetical protein
VEAVELIFVLPLLGQDALGFLERLMEGRPDRLWLRLQLPFNVALNPPHQSWVFSSVSLKADLTASGCACSCRSTSR